MDNNTKNNSEYSAMLRLAMNSENPVPVLISIISSMKKRLDAIDEELKKDPIEESGIEKMVESIAKKISLLEKGEKGDIGDAGMNGEKGDMGEKGEKGEKGDIGPKGDKGDTGDRGEKGEKGDNGKDGSPDTALDIRNKLESLTGNERLDISAIKGVEERLAAIPSKSTSVFGPGKTKIVRVDLSSQLNGVLKTFYLGTHCGIVDVLGSSSPFVFREGVDYNESGKSIVFTNAVDAAVSLASDQTLIVKILR